ncbi:MAG: GtrA family protein [Flavobacteriales bacterium]|nr:GtrA family protein [Flavobacteriales bacterium]
MKESLYILLKFGLVGASGVFIDFGVTWLLKEKVKMHKYAANSLGFMLAASNNYIWNRLWTFESSDPDVAAQYLVFILVSLGGLAFNNAALWLFHEKQKFNFYFSKVLAVLVAMFWNFIGYKFIAFT